MVKIDEVIDHVRDSKDLQRLISGHADVTVTNCDSNSNVIMDHQDCFELTGAQMQEQSLTVLCHRALLNLIIRCIAVKPSLVDDDVKKQLSSHFKKHNLKAQGLVNQDVLNILNDGSGSQILTWIKYESLLVNLIQECIYEPKTMADEVLAMVKSELHHNLAAKLSPVLSTCAKICRKVNAGHDDELEEKWCEIIEWIGWFISGDENDMDGT